MVSAVLVDDTDSNIQYSGTWLPISNYGDIGDFGQPLRNTFHSALSLNASLTYNFTGNGIEIYGINQPNVEGAFLPFSCSIDHQSYPTVQSGSNGALCRTIELSNASHMLELVIPSPARSPFMFDYIKYFPTIPVTPEDHATVSIDFSDQDSLPDGYNGTGWEDVTTNGTHSLIARDSSTTFELEFNGTSFTWFGLYDGQYPSTPTTASYSIDNQDPVSFSLKGVSNGCLFNQTIFQIVQLSNSSHKIVVNYGGNNNTVPLSITNIIIQNGTIPEPPQLFSSTATNLTNTTATTTSSLPTKSSRTAPSDFPSATAHNTGLIIGCTLAAIFVGVCIILVATYLCRRKYRKSIQNDDIQAFSIPPSTYLPTWLHRRKDLEGAGQLVESDTLQLNNSPARMIPPRKMTQVVPQSPLQSPRLSSPISVNIQAVSRVVDIQEEDSGVRLSQIQEGNSETVTRLLPPAYTEL